MLNEVVLVGRISQMPKAGSRPNSISDSHMVLEVRRSFRNSHGDITSDHIDIQLWKGIASDVIDFCHDRSILAIKGRLERTNIGLVVVAEKITIMDAFY